uniref:C2H2-type domain-containing protein n=2 Tax=Lutzomyia longipalpis TaxID=7200 RepID=A0A1B0EWZ8_LUTLO
MCWSQKKRRSAMRKDRVVKDCQYCGKKYKFTKSLSKHIEKAHKAVKDEVENEILEEELKRNPAELADNPQSITEKESVVFDQLNRIIKSEPESEDNDEEEHSRKAPEDPREKEEVKIQAKIEFIDIQESSLCDEKGKKDFSTRCARTTEKGEKEYICAICKKIYPRPSRLRRHFRKHTGEKRTKWFNCNTCQKQFSTEEKLTKHNLRKHSSNEGSCVNQKTSNGQANGEDPTELSLISLQEDTRNSFENSDERDILGEVDIKLEPDEADDGGEVDEFADFYPDENHHSEDDKLKENFRKKEEKLPTAVKPKTGTKRPKEARRTDAGGLPKRGGPFKCTYCRLSYSHQKFLDRHLLYHTEKEKPFPCKSCEKQFDKSSELRFHREKVHAQEKCDVCGEMMVSLHDRQRHKTMHAEKKYKFECGICQKRLCRLKSLQNHIERTHMGEKFKCEICLKGFPRVGLLMAHSIEKHGNEKPFSCKMCGFKVNRLASLRSHMITHTKEKNFHCETCGKAFGHSSTFHKHLRMHERAKMPPPIRDKLDEVARARETRERLFQCEVCAKAFIRMADLKLHLRFHSDVRPYKCTVCPKAFHSSSIMKNHIDRHFGIRKHVCKHCGLTYTDPTGLRRHLVKHGDSRVKTFACDQCGKIFVQKYQLIRHTSTHIPGSQTRRRGGVHPREKREEYQCRLCQKVYIHKSGLKKHLQKHGDGCGKQIECPQCNKRYLDAEELGRHLDTHVNPVVTEVSYPSLIVTPAMQQDIFLPPTTQVIILPGGQQKEQEGHEGFPETSQEG